MRREERDEKRNRPKEKHNETKCSSEKSVLREI